MKKPTRKSGFSAARLSYKATLTAALLCAGSTANAETLRMVTNWGATFYSVERTLQWVEEFNASDAATAADIRIVHAGGPEVTPATEQMTALSSGVIDILFGSAGYYVGSVPEAYAIYASPITPMQARDSGALELFDDIYREKANAHVLGWVAAGVGYHLWLKDEPAQDADGQPLLSGVKVRSSGFYNAWLESLGATTVSVPAPDIYTSLERGVVDGAAWPGLGVTDFGWEKFIGYRIDPPVWQFDNMLWINDDKWNGLDEAQQNALAESVEAFEPVAHEFYASLAEEERAAVEASGVASFKLDGDAQTRYTQRAQDLQWQQVQQQVPDAYEALRNVMTVD